MKVQFIWNLIFICLLTSCFLCSFSSQAQAQCDRDLHINLDYDASGHTSSAFITCDTMPKPATAKTTGGREIMVTFSGGLLVSSFPTSVYATFPLIDNSNNNHNPCPSNNGFGTQMQMNFSEAVAFVNFGLVNNTDVSQTYTITSSTETQQVTIAARSVYGINVGQDLTQNAVSNITVVSTSNNNQWAYSIYGLFTILYYDETGTKAGSLNVYPEEVATTGGFTVLGFNWLNLGASTAYRVLFDNNVIAEETTICGIDPQIGVAVPCGVAAGTHTVTCQIIKSDTKQVLGSTAVQLNVVESFNRSAVGTDCDCIPQMGTIVANPNSGMSGNKVSVTGTGWTNKVAGTEYRLIFNGIPVAQQKSLGCNDQPNMQFIIPCGIEPGVYDLVNQLVDSNTNQVIFNSAPTKIQVVKLEQPTGEPTISLSPDNGFPDDIITVTGNNWPTPTTTSEYVFTLGTIEVGRQTINSCEMVQPSIQFKVPMNAPSGRNRFFVALKSSQTKGKDVSVSEIFTVKNVVIDKVTPEILPAGLTTLISITGKNFSTNAKININVSGSFLKAKILTNFDTQMTISVTVDTNAIDGKYDLTVCNGKHCSNPQPVFVRVPHHLQVVSDDSGTVASCSNVIARRIIFRVVNANKDIVGQVFVKENFISVSQNTCGNGQPRPSPCRLTDNAQSEFTDFITTNNCTSGSPGCGYNITDLWEWCPPKNTPVGLGRLIETVHSNQITVNGVATPSQIPVGTDILP